MTLKKLYKRFISMLIPTGVRNVEGKRIKEDVAQLWNNVKMDIRMVNSFLVFKRILYETIFGL